MKTKLLFSMVALAATTYFSAQNVSVFSNVPFYSMYHYLGEGESLPAEAYSQIPAEAIRMHAYERDVIARKLSVVEIATLGSEISIAMINNGFTTLKNVTVGILAFEQFLDVYTLQ